MVEVNEFNTPILFLIFNRPDSTFKVFEEIRKIRPRTLYVAADGARINKNGEKEKCEKARSVIKTIDWECEVKTLFRNENLGCKVAVSSAISWFFEQEEEGIILEDDCLPSQSFFRFCSEMLVKYRTDFEVMHIGGNNFIDRFLPLKETYYFSKYCHIWGWATWRRAWESYDVNMKQFPEFFITNELENFFPKNLTKYYWLYKFIKVYFGEIDTWDYQWTFSIWTKKGKSITPSINLVSNIGFNANATHDLRTINELGNLPHYEISEIIHPRDQEINLQADHLTGKVVFKLTFMKKIACLFLVRILSLKKIK